MSQSKSILPTLEELVAANQNDTSRATQRKKWQCLDGLSERDRNRALQLLWRHLNQERKRKQDYAYRKRNPEKVRGYQRKYFLKNKDRIADYNKVYAKTKNRRDVCRKYYQSNKGECDRRTKLWESQNPGIKVHYASVRRARKKASETRDAKEKIREIRSREKNACLYCGKIVTRKNLHIDHYIPLSKGGTHSADNLVPSCDKCNLSKSASHPHDFITGTLPLFI